MDDARQRTSASDSVATRHFFDPVGRGERRGHHQIGAVRVQFHHAFGRHARRPPFPGVDLKRPARGTVERGYLLDDARERDRINLQPSETAWREQTEQPCGSKRVDDLRCQPAIALRGIDMLRDDGSDVARGGDDALVYRNTGGRQGLYRSDG